MIYNNKDITTINGINHYKNKLIPVITHTATDEYIITTVGDRLDLLAYSYYKNSQYWRIIASANSNIPNDSIFITPGTQIRIPININSFINEFNKLNTIR